MLTFSIWLSLQLPSIPTETSFLLDVEEVPELWALCWCSPVHEHPGWDGPSALDPEHQWLPGGTGGGQSAMVTHSRFDSAMSSSPFEGGVRLPPHRYKTFSSRAQYQMVIAAVRKLQESGFYWSTVSGKEASALLSSEPPGTFLVRDSSDHHHFFTLSVKTTTGTKNLRIQCDSVSFFLQTDPRSEQAVPRFDCVLKLIHHYMPSPGTGASSKVHDVGEGGSAADGSAYYIYSGGEKIPLELLRPLASSMSSLQHLCRKTLNGHIDVSTKRDQLPHPLQEFLQEYDAPI
ncbi:suppressor of cytokine signaling 3-like protein [Labeo rohita]|uniref:Suppressor of cytokine signaling 3 n=3 Tax=Labeo rohita TaxID=84645 RepID=A0A498MQZ7_LABRO|nr:Suppressor of cytokine signaling 3 [Labeo rohita]RXN10133.1 suppressor of cytokine signaling 3-like protein [Labeo rohita]RXN23988.1 suppressor of cytokine signaling 3-like protein [Labeo rohita]